MMSVLPPNSLSSIQGGYPGGQGGYPGGQGGYPEGQGGYPGGQGGGMEVRLSITSCFVGALFYSITAML